MRRIQRWVGLAIGLLCYPHEWEETDRFGRISFQACRWCPQGRIKIKKNDGRPMPRPTAT